MTMTNHLGSAHPLVRQVLGADAVFFSVSTSGRLAYYGNWLTPLQEDGICAARCAFRLGVTYHKWAPWIAKLIGPVSDWPVQCGVMAGGAVLPDGSRLCPAHAELWAQVQRQQTNRKHRAPRPKQRRLR
jgi:hypothetical protein